MIDHRIKTFIMLVKTRSFSKTAESLNITQPAVSQHIKSLENEYDVSLLINRRKDMKLTSEGRILYEYAVEVNRISRVVEAKLKNKCDKTEKYHIGATMTIGGCVMPPILGLHKQKNPNIDIMLRVENTRGIIDELIKGEIDFGVVEGPFDKTKFKFEKFRDDELVLVSSPDHEFAKKDFVSVDMVLKSKLILREKGSGTRKILEDELIKNGYEFKDYMVYMEIGSINALVSLVESNIGCTIISREAVKDSLETGKLVEIPMDDFKIMREFNFIYFEESQFLRSFIKFCKDI
jgi:DNA-binding transcriptional LysR family regulator